jgi:hypothetical protein
VRKLAGIVLLSLAGLAAFLAVAYLLLLTEFHLPIGPPLVLLALVGLSFTAVVRLGSRGR